MKSALKAFEDSDADREKILDIYTTAFSQLRKVSSQDLKLLRQICRISDDDRRLKVGLKVRHFLLNLAVRLQEEGIEPEDYKDSFLTLYLSKLAKRACDKNPFSIPIPG